MTGVQTCALPILGLGAFRAGGPWADREESEDYWGSVLSGLGGHGQTGRRVGITGARCFQGWGGYVSMQIISPS